MTAWLAKGVLGAFYWFTCLYAIGGLLGDRVVAGRIVPPAIAVPPALVMLAAILLYAGLSCLWDRWRRPGGR